MLLLVAIVAVALSISFLCSLWEAAFLSIRTAELRARASSGERSARRLLWLKTDRHEEAMSGILTLNTIAHTVGAAASGAQAAKLFGDAGVGIFSAILTMLVLVLTEVIPKTMGHLYNSQLVPFVGLSLALLVRTPFALLAITTKFLSRGHKKPPPSLREIETHIENANRLGTLNDISAELLRRGVQLEGTSIGDIMRPRIQIPTLPWDADVARALREASEMGTPWVLVAREQQEDDQWSCVDTRRLPDDHPTDPARIFASEPLALPETTEVHLAFQRWWTQRLPVILVFDERGDTVGLVSEQEVAEHVLPSDWISIDTPDHPQIA